MRNATMQNTSSKTEDFAPPKKWIHPENRPQPVEAPTDSVRRMPNLCFLIFATVLSGLIGAAIASAAFALAFMGGDIMEVVSLTPLVLTAIAIITGWVGAFFWMCREGSEIE